MYVLSILYANELKCLCYTLQLLKGCNRTLLSNAQIQGNTIMRGGNKNLLYSMQVYIYVQIYDTVQRETLTNLTNQ